VLPFVFICMVVAVLVVLICIMHHVYQLMLLFLNF
jgi:hypothetical protein